MSRNFDGSSTINRAFHFNFDGRFFQIPYISISILISSIKPNPFSSVLLSLTLSLSATSCSYTFFVSGSAAKQSPDRATERLLRPPRDRLPAPTLRPAFRGLHAPAALSDPALATYVPSSSARLARLPRPGGGFAGRWYRRRVQPFAAARPVAPLLRPVREIGRTSTAAFRVSRRRSTIGGRRDTATGPAAAGARRQAGV